MKNLILSAILAAFTLAPAAPAVAGGSFSVQVDPTNADEANAIRAGLAIFAIAKALEGDASILQNGMGNAAAIGQNGDGNWGVVQQEGNGHTGTLSQNGDGNAYGIFQFGEGTDGHVNQTGDYGTGLLFQVGW